MEPIINPMSSVQPESTSPVPSSVQSTSWKDKIAVFAIVFFMILVLSVLGYEMYQYVNLVRPQESNNSATTALPLPNAFTTGTPATHKPTSIANATWETYQSTPAAYLFTYPNTFTVNNDSETLITRVDQDVTPVFEVQYISNYIDPDIWRTNTTASDPEKYLGYLRTQTGQYLYPNWYYQTSQFLNDPAVFVQSENPLLTPQALYIVKHNNAMYVIKYNREDALSTAVNRIVSSFRFTTASSASSSASK